MGTLAEGIKEIFATAKTTGSNVMLCGNDGTPDGHMTMENLASVLGATFNQTSATDFNAITTPGVYRKYDWTSFAHFPAGASDAGILIVSEGLDGGWAIQKYYGNNGDAWERSRNIGAQKDTPWRRTDNFGYNTLSDLANALGEIPVYTTPSISSSVTESIMITFNEISNFGVRLAYTPAAEEAAYIISKQSNGTGICILFRPMSGVSQIFIGYIANGSITWRYI